MNEPEWADLVDEINVAYPHQQVDLLTAASWFRSLQVYSYAELYRALDRCKLEREFISSYALAEAVRDERRERSATRSTTLPLPARGAAAPPEWKEMRSVLERSKLLPGHPDHIPGPIARQRLDELADYHAARLAEESTAPRKEQQGGQYAR